MSKIVFKCVERPPSSKFALLRAQTASQLRAAAAERNLPSLLDRFTGRVAQLMDDACTAPVAAESLVALLHSAKLSLPKEAFHRLVNHTSARGTTPLFVAPTQTRPLLQLGADPIRALDGALYNAVKENTSRGVATLIESYLEHFQQEKLARIVTHTRIDGVNAAVVAVMFSDAALLHLLVQIGARLDAVLAEVAELAGNEEITRFVKTTLWG